MSFRLAGMVVEMKKVSFRLLESWLFGLWIQSFRKDRFFSARLECVCSFVRYLLVVR
jgi:hypothetical protein